jgi:hypothetical protein
MLPRLAGKRQAESNSHRLYFAALKEEEVITALGAISGAAAVFGDFIAADTVLPARHGFLSASEAARHVLEEIGPDANTRVRTHSILVVGKARRIVRAHVLPQRDQQRHPGA